jgi:acyl-CoA thioester hydrolase
LDEWNRLHFRVYFEDTDAQGVVYYANYLRYMERGRTEWLREHDVQHSVLQKEQGLFFTVAEMQLKYHQPARLDDQVYVLTRLAKLGRVRFDFEQQVRCGSADGELLVAGLCRAACVDAQTFRPSRIPAGLFGDTVTGTTE